MYGQAAASEWFYRDVSTHLTHSYSSQKKNQDSGSVYAVCSHHSHTAGKSGVKHLSLCFNSMFKKICVYL